MEGESKENENVWTTENIRQECNNWTLEADTELLKHLQQFSQKLLLETHTALKSLDVLESQLNTTYVKFSTVSNSFLSLSDTQFVENRVYEDEESASNLAVASKVPEDTSNKNEDKVIVDRLKEALNSGFKVLNEKFKAVRVPESDSEDDEDDNSIKSEMLLKPVNPYEDMVLPYLIGSAEFNSDDTVGLEDVPSEDEIEEALSESDKVSESEDSEPESDQTKAHEAVEDIDQDNIIKYNQVNLAGQLSVRTGDSSNQNVLNSKGQKSFGTAENIGVKNTSLEIKASLSKENNSSVQSFSTSSSSNEFVGRPVHNSYRDDPGPFFSDNEESDNLFQDEPSFKPQKAPVGGISVLRPGVQLPATKAISQRTTDKSKQSNTDYGSLFESDTKPSDLFEKTSVSTNDKPNYYDKDEDDNLFSQSEKSTTENDDIFSDSKSNKPSKFNPVSNNDLKKSFWLDSEKNVIDDSDNIFDSKGIFSDDDDEDLFSANKQTQSVNKKKISKISNIQSKVNIDEPSLFADNDIFSSVKSSSSSANFFDIVSGTGSSDKSSRSITNSKDKLFDDLFDDFNDEDDLFKDILPSKTIAESIQNNTDETMKKKTEEVKPVDKMNNQNTTLIKQTESVKSSGTVNKQDVPKQNEQIEKVTSHNITMQKQIKQIKSIDKIDNQRLGNSNLSSETRSVSSIVDFEDTDDLFAEPTSSSSFFTVSKLKEDILKKEITLFDDSGSDDDLFSTSKSFASSKTLSASVDLSQEKKHVKDLFSDDDFKPSYNDNKQLFRSTENSSEDDNLFGDITSDNIHARQTNILTELVDQSTTSKSPDNIISNNTTLATEFESIFEEKKKKPDTFPKPVSIKPEVSLEKSLKGESVSNLVITNKIQPPKTLNIGQSTVKNNVIQSSQDIPDGSVLSSSLGPSPGKLSAELTKNIDPTALLPGSRPKLNKQEELLPSDTISTLQSVIKERPKIQVKRRPPSRRARQEAIRASKLVEEYSSVSEIINTTLEPPSYLSPSTDEDDFFTNSNLTNDNISPNLLNVLETPTDLSSNLLNAKSLPIKEDSKKKENNVSKDYNPEFNLFSDVETVKIEENKSLKHSNKTTNEDINKLVVDKKPRDIFDEESDDDLFGEISSTQKSYTTSKSVNISDEWLNGETNENEDFLFPQTVTTISSQSKRVKTSDVQSKPVKEEKPKTNMTFEEKDIFEEDGLSNTEPLFFTKKEAKVHQIPKTNFLFEDEDGDTDDIFSQSVNVTSQVKPKSTNELGTHAKTSGHSTQKVKLSSQQVFTDPLMLMQND